MPGAEWREDREPPIRKTPLDTQATVFVPSVTEQERHLRTHDEVVAALEPHVRPLVDKYLLGPEKNWLPSKLLPDLERPDWREQLHELRKQADGVSDGVWVVLVGDTITEEALPSYQTWINRIPAIRDRSGVDQNAWGRWSRGWTGEESRHGDTLTAYLRYSGRVNMPAVERSVQGLITNGFDPRIGEDPYKAFVYTAFQERATRISHRNVARLAKMQGAETLHKICGSIAGDESRHEGFYTGVMKMIFDQDPDGAMRAFNDMMQEQVVMPAALMTDGEAVDLKGQSRLFTDFSNVAQALGVYTSADYVGIIRHLRDEWQTDTRQVSGEGAKAQEELAKYSEEYGQRLDKVMMKRISHRDSPAFSWIHGREVPLLVPGVSLR